MYTFVTYVFLLVLSTLPPLFLSVHSLSTFLPIISHAFHLCQSVFLVLPMLSLLLTFLPLLIFQTLHVSVFLAVFLLFYLYLFVALPLQTLHRLSFLHLYSAANYSHISALQNTSYQFVCVLVFLSNLFVIKIQYCLFDLLLILIHSSLSRTLS